MLSERATTSNLCTRDHSQYENFDNTPTVVDTMEPVVFSHTIGAIRRLLLSRRPTLTGSRHPHLTLHRHSGASA